MLMKVKQCPKCGEFKELSAFITSGYYCLTCVSIYNKEYRKNNYEQVLETERKYRINNIEKRKEKDRKYYVRNRERILEKGKKYLANNPEIRRKFYANTREHILEWRKLQCANLSDGYIANAIFKVKISELPKVLIECKRLQLQILRECNK